MRLVARECKKNPRIRALAAAIVFVCPSKDYLSEVRALWSFVSSTIRYLGDITDVETIQTAEKTLELGQGDCDDVCVLLAALLEAINHPTRFVALSFTRGHFSHVIVETLVGSPSNDLCWIPVDATQPEKPFGWYPPPGEVLRRMVIHNGG